uniref:Uncharacterized protein n=1 Tax=Stomoxys calcitrans TaxID=35570 RepID=A0A1I8Q4G1_STOCA
MQKSSRSNSNSSANNSKEKPNKLKLTQNSDRNANSTSTSPTATTTTSNTTASSASVSSIQGGTIRKSSTKRSRYSNEEGNQTQGVIYQDENYMEFDFFAREGSGQRESSQFTELFRDFPVCYEATTLPIPNSQKELQNPPPYRDPPPPTPPPLSQLPSRNPRNAEASGVQSCPSSPFRGKVVLSKKERKELSKLAKQQDNNTSNSTSNIRTLDSSDSGSASHHSSPYKGRVTELKNCIARINSKGIFASLHRSSQKSLNAQTAAEEQSSSHEVSPPPPAPESSPPGSNASNNNDADYTEKLKNLPVRQRKAHTSHMDNYCLFDPMDFVNEKTLRRRTHDSLLMDLPLQQQHHGLRDPLFSSRQNLDFSEEELVPEVIYDDQEEATEAETKETTKNFDHHNYFVIDPDDFEEEPSLDIGIPNPFTNEQVVQANLTAEQHTYVNNADALKASESLEKLLNAFETAPSMSNSQESKDTTNSTATTTSTALVESSTSTNSNSSSTSNTSSQTTLQRTKKKLTFLNLSPFRSNKSPHSDKTNSKKTKSESTAHAVQSQQQRAVSEFVNSEHMFHLQQMLLSADNVLNDVRSHHETIELNYVLFNPGPVPSRNVQYKIRKPRPLSTHSDADSGFLSPCSPDEFSSLKSNPAILVLQQCDSVQGYIE